jgi:hypothetical protein
MDGVFGLEVISNTIPQSNLMQLGVIAMSSLSRVAVLVFLLSGIAAVAADSMVKLGVLVEDAKRNIDADGVSEVATSKRALKEGSARAIRVEQSLARAPSFLQAAPAKAVTKFLAVGEVASGSVEEGENKITHHVRARARAQSGVRAKVAHSYTIVVHRNASLVVSRMEKEPLEWLNSLDMPYELETEPDEIPEGGREPLTIRPHQTLKPLAYDGRTTYECGGYLNFIVNEYYDLPSVVIFVQGQPLGNPSEMHGNWNSMHGDPHIFSVIRQIAADPSKVRSYCSLNREFGSGSSQEVLTEIENTEPMRFQSFIAGMKPLFSEGGEKGQLECYNAAQFAVSRERIHSHPLSFYKEFLDWLRDDSIGTRCGVLEGAWHRIFGEDLVCPRDADRCAFVYGEPL